MGMNDQFHSAATVPTRKEPSARTGRASLWASEPVLTLFSKKKILISVSYQTPAIPVPRRDNKYVITLIGL
jgi:hypothetical protein